MELFDKSAQPDWPWFEEYLTYDNAKLSHALILSGHAAGQQPVLERGLQTLRWLTELQTSEHGHFRPIGSNGFYRRGGPRADFDQQPIEAHATISACLEAFRVTSDSWWFEQAQRAFDWFLGWNDLGHEVYAPDTGGCRDALHVDRANRNQGAESTLAFLLSLAEMRLMQNSVTSFRSARRHLRRAMNNPNVNVKRSKLTLAPDYRRVLIRPFRLASEERVVKICARVLVLPEEEVQALLKQVLAEFDERHMKVRNFLRQRFEQIRPWMPTEQKISEERELLIGAYFSHEYSFEATALFNPSIVPHPDQSDLPPGSLRFAMSLRATGEGHISSITFRTGFLDANCKITVNEPTRFNLEPAQAPNASYEKALFERKLRELGGEQ